MAVPSGVSVSELNQQAAAAEQREASARKNLSDEQTTHRELHAEYIAAENKFNEDFNKFASRWPESQPAYIGSGPEGERKPKMKIGNPRAHGDDLDPQHDDFEKDKDSLETDFREYIQKWESHAASSKRLDRYERDLKQEDRRSSKVSKKLNKAAVQRARTEEQRAKIETAEEKIKKEQAKDALKLQKERDREELEAIRARRQEKKQAEREARQRRYDERRKAREVKVRKHKRNQRTRTRGKPKPRSRKWWG